MECMKLRNPMPPNGSDISGNFVAQEDEKREIDEKTKEIRVTNSKDISFPAGCDRTFDIKTAKHILKIWGFVRQIGEPFKMASKDNEDPLDEDLEDDVEIDVIEDEDDKVGDVEDIQTGESPEEEFLRMKKERAWLNPLTKDRYNELKKQFKK